MWEKSNFFGKIPFFANNHAVFSNFDFILMIPEIFHTMLFLKKSGKNEF